MSLIIFHGKKSKDDEKLDKAVNIYHEAIVPSIIRTSVIGIWLIVLIKKSSIIIDIKILKL